jgi:predicted metal-dependent hydrolase
MLPFNGNKASGPLFFDIALQDKTFRITLKRTARARRFTLRIRAATHDIILTMPSRGSLAEARSFAERHAAWIGTRLELLPKLRRFEPGECVPLRGCLHEIAHCPGRRGTVWIEAGIAKVEGTANPALCVSGEASFVARRVRDFLIREARRDLAEAIARHATRLGVAPRKLSLRDTTSRWGSCSSTGALSFSWRLIMAPPHVLDYLAAHEVTHMRHMNHSPAFWRTLIGLYPETERAEAWLKASGAELLRFGQADDFG